MPQVYAPMLMTVLVVAMFGLIAWMFTSGVLDEFYAWINKEIWALAPPSWPRPVPPTADTPSSGDEPGPDPTPAPTPESSDPPWCPDGSGTCESDDKPVVPPVGYPPGCEKDDISVNTFNHRQTWDRWTTIIPIFGPLFNGISMCTGGGATRDPQQGATDALQEAMFSLKQAGAVWEDAYVNLLDELGPTVLRVSKDIFSSDGLINMTAEAAAMPLVQAARLLIAPMLGLLVCSLLLVWAV